MEKVLLIAFIIGVWSVVFWGLRLQNRMTKDEWRRYGSYMGTVTGLGIVLGMTALMVLGGRVGP